MSRKVSGMFDDTDFDRSLIPNYLKKECREIIEAAVMLGWKMHISSGNSVTIVAPEEKKKYHFSASGRASNSIPRIRRDVVRFADPTKLLLVDSMAGTDNKDIWMAASAMLPHLGDEGTVIDHRPELEREAEAERQRKEAAAEERARRKAAAPLRSSMGDRDDEPNSTHQRAVSQGNRHIVSEGPMRAKAGDRSAYDSEVTIQRLWSDGTKDYKCVKCDYWSTQRQSVAAHNARKHPGVTSPRPATYQAVVTDATVYAPRQTRIDALADIIAGLIAQGGVTDPKVVAKTALTWVHDQHRKGTEFSEDVEPRTPDEVLNRIRTLLDDGTRLRETLRLSELETRVLEAEERAEQAEQRAAQAKSTLRAFMDLASELSAEDGEEQTA